MKIYLVGGAVRDALLGLPIHEKDWVVVGSTPEELLQKGYLPVGKEFPVFLHPLTKEETALARTERKKGKGHLGFECFFDKEVTLEEDLARRDLTINAMAQEEDGAIIDPYGGREDLEARYLRHVSEAFVEDPLRVLRVARFAAKFPDFTVHPETQRLLKRMVASGELAHLSPERVWQEWEKALKAVNPIRFLEVLETCGALPEIFPILTPQGREAFSNSIELSQDPCVRFAALWQGVSEERWKHWCAHSRIPVIYQELSGLVCRWGEAYSHVLSFSADQVLNLLESTDAFRRPERFQQWLIAVRAGYPATECQQITLLLQRALETATLVKVDPTWMALSGAEIATHLKQARVNAIQQVLMV